MATVDQTPRTVDWSSEAARSRRRRRYAKDKRLKIYGIVAITIAIAVLAVLLISLFVRGWTAFSQTIINVELYVDPEVATAETLTPRIVRDQIIGPAVQTLFPDLEGADLRRAGGILTPSAFSIVYQHLKANPHLIGQPFEMAIPVADEFDQLYKGNISRETPEERRLVSDAEIAYFDRMVEEGQVTSRFNWGLIFNIDSIRPELAGLRGAIVGSFYLLLVTFLVSFPVGIAAAIYLEEFAPKNRWTSLIEININNLAAVPSIVFGLLGLAVFLNFFGLPRSAPLVGGLVLSLMTLPTMIIVTRAALKAVPPSIREGGYGIGASKHQVVMHHVLPLALPGILTGTIIGLAQALGETAPLLLVGMNAFIASEPGGLTDAATALPTQILIWSGSSERGFIAKTQAAIIVLLFFLITMNAIAIYLRRRLERTW